MCDHSSEEMPVWRFDPVDITQMRLLAQLPPGWRIQTMLESQAFARSLILGRLHQQFPEASTQELGLKLLERVSRDIRTPSF